ncbi:MAG: ABC transporter permease subunit [Actinomycetales bacterium]|nr:ABC transporter permease subunit [Actinomycetales bacterium]
MAKDAQQPTMSPEQKARLKARAKQARQLEGGHPSLRGILIKIALLAIVDAGAMFAALLLIAQHQWLYFSVELIATVLLNYLYLRKGHLPAKYLAPGVVLLILFQISVVFFSGFIAFTNYGALHNGSKEDAMASIKLSSMVTDTNAPFMYASIVTDSKHNNSVEFLATDVTDPNKPLYYIGGADYATQPWHQLTAAEQATIKEGDASDGTKIAITIAGTKALTLDQIIAQQASLSELKVPLGANIDKAGFMALDPSATGVQRTYYDAVYNAKNDTFTRVSDGKVFYADESIGFFNAKPGDARSERISDTGWRVNIGFGNFERIFGDKSLQKPLLGIFSWTVIFALASVISTFVVGLALALLFNDDRIKGKKIYRSVMILPYAFPAFLSAYVWKGMFNTNNGFINTTILNLPKDHMIPWLTEQGPARWAVLLCNLWLGFPYMFLITTGALQAIPGELSESAMIDGATPWQQFRLIKLPLLLISLAPLLISSFAFNFNNFTIIYLITGGGPSGDPSLRVDAGGTDILISFVYKIAFSTGVGADYGLASAFSILIFFIVGGISFFSFRRTQFLEDLA